MRTFYIVVALLLCGCAIDRFNDTHPASIFTDLMIVPLIEAGLEQTALSTDEQRDVLCRLRGRTVQFVAAHFSEDELIEVMQICRSKEFIAAMKARAAEDALTDEQIKFIKGAYTRSHALRRFLSKDFMQALAVEVFGKELTDLSKADSLVY